MRILLLAALAGAGLYAQSPQPKWLFEPGQTIQLDQVPAAPVWQMEAPPQKPVWVKVTPGNNFVVTMAQPPAACAIPLLNVGAAQSFKGDPKMVLPNSESKSADSKPADSKEIIQTMPVCPKR